MVISWLLPMFPNLFLCYCESAFFKSERENKSIRQTNVAQPFLNESVENYMVCYMKCLENREKCCLVEIKADKKDDKVKRCILYHISIQYVDQIYEKHSTITSVVDKDCKAPESCMDWYQLGWREDRPYLITVNGKQVNIFCDMTNGGWSVFLRRIDGSVDFARTWNDYKNGFGKSNGEYWLGNDLIHQMTNVPSRKLIKFHTTDFSSTSKQIIFDGFKIADEKGFYKMEIGNVVENNDGINPLDVTEYNKDSRFSTRDNDNDNYYRQCVKDWGGNGGFWYRDCSRMTPTSGYPKNDGTDKGGKDMRWLLSDGKNVFMKSFVISIK